jgi:hypothetical protein
MTDCTPQPLLVVPVTSWCKRDRYTDDAPRYIDASGSAAGQWPVTDSGALAGSL